MKLFVWATPHPIEFGGTCLYVVAETEDQARKLAKTTKTSYYGWDPVDGESINLGSTELGPPTRVVECPCAEMFVWEL